MSARTVLGWLVGVGLVASGIAGGAASTIACGRDTDLSATLVDAAPAAIDAAPSGPTIAVTTRAPQVTSAIGDKANATWAAYRLDEGEWIKTEPVALGTYAIPVPKRVWSLALVCASDDDAFTKVFVHHRTASLLAFEVALEEQCTPEPPPAEYAFSGTLTSLPAATQWFDFGYPRDSRGSSLAAAGGSAPYEVVGIAPGTWDLAFGVRDDSFGVLTRIVLRRGEAISADRKLDVDFAAGGFAPGSKRLVVHGIDPSDTITPRILYAAAGGPSGIDVGPQDVPADQADVTLAYATIPDAMQVGADRYHGLITAERDRRSALRSVELHISKASDLEVTLPPLLAEPRVTLMPTSTAMRIETRVPVVAGSLRHEVMAVAVINRRTQHAWQATFDEGAIAGATEVVDTLPELSGVAGWRPVWGLPLGSDVTVTATVVEVEVGVGDGTMQRTSAKAMTVTP